MRRVLGCLLLAVVAATTVWLAIAQRGPHTEVAIGGSAQYTVRIVVSASRIDPWTLEVADRAGRPAEVDQVTVEPVMPGMGHAAAAVVATPEAPGRYRAEGIRLPMSGQWEITVRLRRGAAQEEILIPLTVAR